MLGQMGYQGLSHGLGIFHNKSLKSMGVAADTVTRQDAFLTSRLSPDRGRRKAAPCSFLNLS